VLPERLAFPPYTAVRESVPTLSVLLVKVALPPASAPLPKVRFPFMNVTVPVGVPDADETVAVNITACPKVDGFNAEVSVTALGSCAWAGATMKASTAVHLEIVVTRALYLGSYCGISPLARTAIALLNSIPVNAPYRAPGQTAILHKSNSASRRKSRKFLP
jgi:hypothetical protein